MIVALHLYKQFLRTSQANVSYTNSFNINLSLMLCLKTHSMLLRFSEKTRSKNSPSSLGSKVDGTMQQTPGGKRNRLHTSRMLMNEGDRATDALYVKKFVSRGVGRFSGSSNCNSTLFVIFFPLRELFILKGTSAARTYCAPVSS